MSGSQVKRVRASYKILQYNTNGSIKTNKCFTQKNLQIFFYQSGLKLFHKLIVYFCLWSGRPHWLINLAWFWKLWFLRHLINKSWSRLTSLQISCFDIKLKIFHSPSCDFITTNHERARWFIEDLHLHHWWQPSQHQMRSVITVHLLKSNTEVLSFKMFPLTWPGLRSTSCWGYLRWIQILQELLARATQLCLRTMDFSCFRKMRRVFMKTGWSGAAGYYL